jgi:hypothetical protein
MRDDGMVEVRESYFKRGEFILQPFGAFAGHRYSFECRPEVVSGQDEPLWIFQVMCW